MLDSTKRAEYDHPTAFSLWGDEERAAIDRVLTSGRLTMGDETEALEEEFALYHGRAHAIAVNSGSSANLVATAALFERSVRPLRRGYRAAVPALAWSTTYAPLVQRGMDLVLADCDGSWCASDMEFSDVQLIVGCSILGRPARLNELRDTARRRGVPFLEDNCESLGAVSPHGLAGTFGDLSTFSLFYSHQISAVEGGVILTDDDELATLCRMLRAHGWTRGLTEPTSIDDEYDFRVMGYNVRPLETHCAIARAQLRKLPAMIEVRRANLATFERLARDLPIILPRGDGQPSPFGLQFCVAAPETRRRLAGALRAAGIDCRPPTGGSLRLHEYGARWRDQRTPAADRIHKTGMFLGCAPWNISDKIERAVDVMREALS